MTISYVEYEGRRENYTLVIHGFLFGKTREDFLTLPTGQERNLAEQSLLFEELGACHDSIPSLRPNDGERYTIGG
jgi:hypothetical protein